MAEKKKMSVAEVLAAARAQAAASAAGGPEKTSAAPESSAESETPPAPKAAKPSGAAKPASPKPVAGAGGRPSVADILAAARANKATGSADKAVEPAAEKPKPAAKPAAKQAAAAAKPATPAAKTGVKRDTASILAAARGAKPGPVSKAEAPDVVAKLQTAAKPKPATAVEKPTAPRVAPPMPARPAKPAKAEPQEDRRNFLEIALGSFMAMGFTALSVTGGLFSLGLARFMFPNVLAEPPSRFKVGFREGFPSGKVETKFVPQYGVWVVNGDFQGQQQIYALKTVCTHLGCTPNWLEAEQKFKCPCHGSGFYKDGINFEGPAPRPLERYAIRIADDGQLEIDKSKTFQEELGQWADPDSYVTV